MRKLVSIPVLWLLGCGDPYSVVVLVEDPEGLASGATRLQVTEDQSSEETSLDIAGKAFPLSFLAISDTLGTKAIQIKVWERERLRAGLAGLIEFSEQSSSANLRLQSACTASVECDDGVWCNGQEECIAARCRPGAVPCAVSTSACFQLACLETEQACEASILSAVEDDDVCTVGVCTEAGIVQAPDPVMEGEFCFPIGGFGDDSLSFGFCTAGRCIPQCVQPSIEDPCRAVRCIGEIAELVEVPLAEGDACVLPGGNQAGRCRQRKCIADDWRIPTLTNRTFDWTDDPEISGDGRWVAFSSSAQLVASDQNFETDVYLYSQANLTSTLISRGADGLPAAGYSRSPSLSSDGNIVAFVSTAANLVANDSNDSEDVFVLDRRTGALERANVSSTGAPTQAPSPTELLYFVDPQPSVSADGNLVCFVSTSPDLVADDTNLVPDAFVRDRARGQTRRVSLGQSGLERAEPTDGCVLAGDGATAFFISVGRLYARDLVGEVTTEAADIENVAWPLSVSHDGSRIALGTLDGDPNVILVDRGTGARWLHRPSLPGSGFDLSGDGQHLAFVTIDGEGTGRVAVAPAFSDQPLEVVALAGSAYLSVTNRPRLSYDGRNLVFLTQLYDRSDLCVPASVR